MEGGGLSGNGSGAGCAEACGVREMFGSDSSGSPTGYPWNIDFFPLVCWHPGRNDSSNVFPLAKVEQNYILINFNFIL